MKIGRPSCGCPMTPSPENLAALIEEEGFTHLPLSLPRRTGGMSPATPSRPDRPDACRPGPSRETDHRDQRRIHPALWHPNDGRVTCGRKFWRVRVLKVTPMQLSISASVLSSSYKTGDSVSVRPEPSRNDRPRKHGFTAISIHSCNIRDSPRKSHTGEHPCLSECVKPTFKW